MFCVLQFNFDFERQICKTFHVFASNLEEQGIEINNFYISFFRKVKKKKDVCHLIPPFKRKCSDYRKANKALMVDKVGSIFETIWKIRSFSPSKSG